MKARVTLKVHAGAKKTGFAGKLGDAWKLSVAAPPTDGKANDAIVRFFADLLSIRASAVRIAAGGASRTKTIEIEGISPEALHRAILGSE